jgi:hypothetical protein
MVAPVALGDKGPSIPSRTDRSGDPIMKDRAGSSAFAVTVFPRQTIYGEFE